MNYQFIPTNRFRKSIQNESSTQQSQSVLNNRFEALKVLSQSLLREVEALNNTKSEDQLSRDVINGKIDLEKEVQKFEIELIRCALVCTGGRQRKAAKLLNVKISTLNAKIKRYGIATSGLDFALR